MTPIPQSQPTRHRARPSPVGLLAVHIWGRRVGAVALDPGSGHYAFSYDPKFLTTGIELAPLSMPLTQGRRPVIFPGLPAATYYRLPAMLADALPDRFGNNLVNAWMADVGISQDQITPLDRLAYTAGRGMGALTFQPARGPINRTSFAVELSNLVEAARQSVSGQLRSADLAQQSLQQMLRMGTSAGGARAKAVVAWNPLTNEIRAGQMDIPDGFQAWLLKFDGVQADYADLGATRSYGRLEYAYSLMAKAAGIDMAECRLLCENGRAHFMTRRFDRAAGGVRHHMQSLCAMAHMDYNAIGVHGYAQLFSTLESLGLAYSSKVEALRRMVFNVLACNRDDHPKNFAFLLRQDAPTLWTLAPAYDLTFAFDPASKWTSRHLMGVNGKFDAIGRADLRAVAERFGLLADFKPVLEQVAKATLQWSEYAQTAGLDRQSLLKVKNSLDSVRFDKL